MFLAPLRVNCYDQFQVVFVPKRLGPLNGRRCRCRQNQLIVTFLQALNFKVIIF